jgi:hypothetical protein
MLFFTSPTEWIPVKEVSIAAASGVTSHLCFFIYGEHHMKAPILFRLYIVLFSVLLYAETAIKNQDAFLGGKEAFKISAAYTLSLLISIVIYRKFFHRLRHFPGPFMASVTKLWQTTKTLDSQNHILLDNLYRKYGDFVRTGKNSGISSDDICILTREQNTEGPSEITVFTPEVKWAVDGPTNQCNKAVWYDILLPLIALNTTRSKKEHDQRRRTWDRAFTLKGLAPHSQSYSDF